MPNLAGLHDREAQAIAVPDTWILDTVALSENPQPVNYDAKFHWITRINWGYGSTGTLPALRYDAFADSAAIYVRDSQNCHRWIIGNETNLPREWPASGPIYPWSYATCYGLARKAIRMMHGHENDEVLIAASGPWNNELKYEGNPTGDWIKYFADVIDLCDGDMDGFAIHSYTHGYNVSLVTSSARMQAPFQNRHYEFRTYRDYLEAIPDELHHLPVYLTEANGDGPWQAVGLMPAMLGEIDAWNKQSKQKVHCVVFYRYPKYDQFYIAGRGDVEAEYRAAVVKGYSSPTGANDPVQTFIPAASSGTSPAQPALPPPDIDPRATARGVTILTPRGVPLTWRVIKIQWYDEQEADQLGPDHHIMADVLDENGKRLVNVPLMVRWPTGETRIVTEAKPGEPYSANFAMSPSRNEFSIVVDGLALSEVVTGIGMGAMTPSGFNAGIHTSTGVIFQRLSATTPPPSTPTGPVAVVNVARGANVRSGPGTDYKVLGAEPYGTIMPIVGRDAHALWWQVDLPHVPGWVSNSVVDARNTANVPVVDAPPLPPQPAPEQPHPAQDNWTRSRAFVAKWEGDYSDNPEDHGNWTGGRKGQGELKGTKYGISAASYPELDIRNLTMAEADAIYFRDYWQASNAASLPWPYCLLAFDTAVLHGVGTSRKWQQEAGDNPYAFAAKRLRSYTKLDNWDVFGAGWVNRVSDLLLEASKA